MVFQPGPGLGLLPSPRSFLEAAKQSYPLMVTAWDEFPVFVRLWVQSDNTVKELRNQYGSKMLSCMTQAGLWGVASCHHLQVGHTHEDVDAIFSLAAVALRTCQPQYLQTPMDIARRLESKLGHLWTKKGLIFNIELVDTVTKLPL